MAKRVWRFWGISIAIAVALVWIHTALRQSIAARVDQRICFPAISHSGSHSFNPPSTNPTSICYSQPIVLSKNQTAAIAVSPDGRMLVSGSRQMIQIWDLQTQTLQSSWQGHNDWITAVAISPKAQLLASASLDGTIKLWDLQTGHLQYTIDAGRVTSLKFSPNGKLLASGSRLSRWADGKISPKGVQLWQVATGQLHDRLGNELVKAIAFSPNGQLLATGNQNTKIWKLATGAQWRTINSGNVLSLTFSQNSRKLISSSNRIKTWEVKTGRLMDEWEAVGSDIALSSNENVLAVARGGTINLLQLQPKRFLGSLRGSHYSGVSFDFSADTNAIISSSSDGIRIWQPQFVHLKNDAAKEQNHQF